MFSLFVLFQNLGLKLSSSVRFAAKPLLKVKYRLSPAPVLQRRVMSSEAENEILTQDIGGKGVLSLNRPKALNSLNLTMIQKLYSTLLQWEKEKSMVIIKGLGGRAFCAGGDVRSITLANKKGEDYGKRTFHTEYLLNCLIATYTIPYVALIDGVTMGGGLGISVHGHYRVATEKTLCAMPETAIGLFPDIGASYFLSRLKGHLGIYLALTGYRLKGIDNLFVKFATHYCPSSEVPKIEKELLACKNPREVLEPFEKVPEGAKFSLEPYLNKIDDIFSALTVEEIYSRLRKDGSDWAKETLSTLQKFSPLSMKITLKELQLGSRLSLQECLQMEYRIAYRCCEGQEFIEGEFNTNCLIEL